MRHRLTTPLSRMFQISVALIFLAGLFGAPPIQASAQTQPWMDTSLTPEQRAEKLLAAMTLDEKLSMVYGNNAGSGGYVGHVPAIPRLGIPDLNLQDGPAGVAGGMIQVTAFPAPITVAASWDTTLMEKYGVAMAEEERDKGANVQLGPMMNMVRVPAAGRNFESFGEDPYLSAQMAAASVRGIQSTGVIATAKHYLDNDQEYQRMTISSEIDDRTQHEIYLPPFKAAVEAGVGSIMCSYNRINGIYACENPDLQNKILKGELGFDGWIMSDWGATHSVAASAEGGLDMEMPTGINFMQLKAAIESEQVPASRLDDMVRRILTAMFRAGLFEHGRTGMVGVNVQTHKDFARQAAAEGMVLLKNEASLLPLDPSRIRSIAVFGTAADGQPVVVGGGSGKVTAPYVVTPLQGIADRARDVMEVNYFDPAAVTGYPTPADVFQTSIGAPGLQVQYFNSPDLSGAVVAAQQSANIEFSWKDQAPAAGVDPSNWSARWTGTIIPPVSGRYNLALASSGSSRLYIDDNLVIDNWGDHSLQSKIVKRRFTGGQAHTIQLEYAKASNVGELYLTWLTPEDDPNQEAAALASQVDAAIVVVGANSGEGGDRQNLDVSDVALLASVEKASSHVIVVVYNPAQVLLPWVDQVQAILMGWIPGQEAGNALADVLFGEVNPSGKLPVTFAYSGSDYPANTVEMYPGVNGQVLYSEGLQVGYRHFDSQDIQPKFPFGYGLSYTTFDYSNLTITPNTLEMDGSVTLTAQVKNTGTRAGAEVVQLYLGFPNETGEPPSQLKGFQKILLQPGEAKTVTFRLTPADYSFWSAGMERWMAYPGQYQVRLGSSSRDIRQSGEFTVQGGPLAGTTYEAEAASLADGTAMADDQTGFSGTGFVRGFVTPGASVSFTPSVETAGQYTLIVRYSSTLRPGEMTKPRSLSLYVNGARVGQVSLPNLANWSMWDYQAETIALNAGENKITYQVDAGDSGDILLDAIILTRIAVPTPIPTQAPDHPAPASAPNPGGSTTGPILVVVLIVVVLLAGGYLLLRRKGKIEK